VTFFKPRGVPTRQLQEIELGLDELEALRLVDDEGLEQVQAAKKMKISQSTLQRILGAARHKVAQGLVEGKAIKVEGGPIEYCRCLRRRGLGRRRCTC
jgi:predicted DNA-binding protein (UPF0251 family)